MKQQSMGAARQKMASSSESGSDFAWKTCADKDSRTRVSLKQQAVDEAFKHAHQLRDVLQQAFHGIDSDNNAAYELMGGNVIDEWRADLAKVEQENKQLEILVGVAGATGAGKTSLLNALLEYPELLPSSSTEAATATVCRIAYNHDDTKGREFRADVKFRTKDAVVKELSDVLGAVKDRKALRELEFEDEDERIREIEGLTEIISRGIIKACAVWGLDEAEIEDKEYTVEAVLANNQLIVDVLGKDISVYSSDADIFASEVKPYLDSTETPEGFTAWPLIEEVRIYVKSDVLKDGIVLVDLPGLSDMVEDRSAVAENYYRKLAVTAIVAPAIRAVDEKTGVKLMGTYQEIRLQLDGKYNKDRFCVVVSKIDDLDCDAFCKASKEAKQDAQLQADVVSTKSAWANSNETYKELRGAERKLDDMNRKCASLREKSRRDSSKRKAAKLRNKRATIMKDRNKLLIQIKTLSKSATQLDRALATLEGRKKFRCVGIRNRYIKTRIQMDFARRQRKLLRAAAYDRDKYDGSVEVFPVCAAAFRDLLEKKKPMLGFPSKPYTGVPKLRQWLGDAVLGHRESHLDTVLRGLQRLYDGVRCWSDDNNGEKLCFSRDEIESILQPRHDMYCQTITTTLTRCAANIQQASPLRNKREKLAACQPLAVQAASRWVYKYPEEINSTQKMAWSTYDAILKRDGGPFQSAAGGRPFYDFPLALGTPFLADLRNDWLQFFQVELPNAERPLMTKAAEIWDQYIDEVSRHIQATAPDIHSYFEGTRNMLDNIRTDFSSRVAASIRSISEEASQIHPMFIEALRAGLVPYFIQALTITGRGHFAKRQSYLQSTLKSYSPHLLETGYTAMETAYRLRTQHLPAMFQNAARTAIRQVKTQIGLLLNNLDAGVGGDRSALDKKVELQKAVKAGVLGWGAVWHSPGHSESGSEGLVDDGDVRVGDGNGAGVDIPTEYVEPVAYEEAGWGEGDGEEGTESEMDSDSEDEDEEKVGGYIVARQRGK